MAPFSPSASPARQAPEIVGLVAALDWHAARYGPHHPQTIGMANQLALALWCAGDTERAIGVLDQALDALDSSLDPNHPLRIEVLCTLGEILVEQGRLQRAAEIYREVLGCSTRRYGQSHPASIAAKGDLAVVLFQLGEKAEAASLESQAREEAQTHLGKTHPVSCVLAWNRSLRAEDCGDADSARAIVVNELAWLLTEDETALAADQRTIRSMLAQRLNWDTAKAC